VDHVLFIRRDVFGARARATTSRPRAFMIFCSPQNGVPNGTIVIQFGHASCITVLILENWSMYNIVVAFVTNAKGLGESLLVYFDDKRIISITMSLLGYAFYNRAVRQWSHAMRNRILF
jgi:hypothetical protein